MLALGCQHFLQTKFKILIYGNNDWIYMTTQNFVFPLKSLWMGIEPVILSTVVRWQYHWAIDIEILIDHWFFYSSISDSNRGEFTVTWFQFLQDVSDTRNQAWSSLLSSTMAARRYFCYFCVFVISSMFLIIPYLSFLKSNRLKGPLKDHRMTNNINFNFIKL